MQTTTAATAYDTYRATRHFGSLDGLRFICIAAVIWHHTPKPDFLIDFSVLFTRGHVGVDFFFVLSGYLITTLLLREEDRDGSFSLRGFYWRRALRIIPVYFLVVFVSAFYAIVIKGYTEQIALLPYYFLFLSNFLVVPDIGFLSVTWSLAVEEQYYLIWPALLLFLPRRWIILALLVLIGINIGTVLGAFGFLGLRPIEAGHLRFSIGGVTYAPILMGSLMAILLHKRRGFGALYALTTFKGAAWVWFTGLLVALAAFPGALTGLPNLVVHSLMCLTLVSLVIREDNAMAPVLQLRPIVRIGQISYGIYLYHLFALVIVAKGLEFAGIYSMGLHFFAYFALAVVIAEISFRTYEAWFMNLRHKGPGRSKQKAPL